MSQLTGLCKRGNAFYLRVVLPYGHPLLVRHPSGRPVGVSLSPSGLAAHPEPSATSSPELCKGSLNAIAFIHGMSSVAWPHANRFGRFEFGDGDPDIDMDALAAQYADSVFWSNATQQLTHASNALPVRFRCAPEYPS